MSDDPTIKTESARTSPESLRLATLAKAIAAPLAACEDAGEALSASAMLAIDVALAAGIDGPVYAKTLEKMWKDRMKLRTDQRLVNFTPSDPGPRASIISNGKKIQ